MSFLRTSLLCGALLSATIVGGVNEAQAQQLSEEARLRARNLYNEAVEAYDLGRYQESLDKWEQAYQISGTKLLLYSIGNAHERLGNLSAAITSLEGYKDSLRDREESRVIDMRIHGLRERLQAQTELEEARQRAIDAELAEQRAKADDAERARMDAEERLYREQLQALRADPKGLVAVRWTTISLAFAGIATGVGFHIQANSHENQLRDRCSSTAISDRLLCDDSTSSLWNKRDTARTASYIAYGAAAGFGVIGLTTLFIHPNRNASIDDIQRPASMPAARELSISPSFMRDGAAVNINARF